MTSLRWPSQGEWADSRRERIAVAAMQALLSNNKNYLGNTAAQVAEEAVRQADALIAALDGPQTKKGNEP